MQGWGSLYGFRHEQTDWNLSNIQDALSEIRDAISDFSHNEAAEFLCTLIFL